MRAVAILAGAAVIALGPSAAQAQRGGPVIGSNMSAPGVLKPAERFKAADADGDGKVTKPEFRASLNPDAQRYINFIWADRDKNGDGWLTQEEMTSNGPSLRPGRPDIAAAAAGAAQRPAQ